MTEQMQDFASSLQKAMAEHIQSSMTLATDLQTFVSNQMQQLRRFLSNDIPACLPFRPSSVLRQPLHSPLCAGWRALNTNEDAAHPGSSFSGNRLMDSLQGAMTRLAGGSEEGKNGEP